jgi:isoleucyl-tRNA synthetase
MLERAAALARDCRAWFDEFEFHRAYHALHDFCVVDLSAFYFDVLKDRLYTFAPRNVGRRSAQTAVYRIASALVRLLAPTLAFTAEEIWKHLPRASGDPESVHIALFPAAENLSVHLPADKVANWERLLAIRTEVLKALELARNEKIIGGGLEAKVTLGAAGDLAKLLNAYASSLPALFIVSQVDVVANQAPEPSSGDSTGLAVKVSRADGQKCERCWNYSTHVGESDKYPTACERCLAALAEIKSSAGRSVGS